MSKNSSFSVPGVMDVQVESFPNSITGQERETKSAVTRRIHLHFWRAWTKIMYIAPSNINFERIRQRCFLFISEIQGLVICWLAKIRSNKKEKKSQVGITGLPFSISNGQ